MPVMNRTSKFAADGSDAGALAMVTPASCASALAEDAAIPVSSRDGAVGGADCSEQAVSIVATLTVPTIRVRRHRFMWTDLR
jgi:hypothetical protein